MWRCKFIQMRFGTYRDVSRLRIELSDRHHVIASLWRVIKHLQYFNIPANIFEVHQSSEHKPRVSHSPHTIHRSDVRRVLNNKM